METATIKCPECGAKLTAAETAEQVRCEYCGTESRIRRRTRFLGLPERLPAGPSSLPVATVQATNAWIKWIVIGSLLSGLIIPVAIGVFTCGTAIKIGSTVTSSFTLGSSKPGPNDPRWGGGGIITADLTGDGVQDVIAHQSVISPSPGKMMVAAFDLAKGKQLWASSSVGDFKGIPHEPMVIASKTIVRSDGGAGMLGLNAADGSTRWQIRLNEVIKRICAGDDEASVLVETADEKRHPIKLADGSLLPARDGDNCAPLPSTKAGADRPNRLYLSWHDKGSDLVVNDKIDGMSSSESFALPDKDLLLAIGHKRPGTQIPMLAAYRWPGAATGAEAAGPSTPTALHAAMRNERDPRRRRELIAAYSRNREQASQRKPQVLWTAVIPGVDPLTAKSSSPNEEQVDLDSERVIVAYEMPQAHAYRLTAFNIADGRRLWDIALPGDSPLSAIAITPTHALASRWDGLYAFDVITGRPARTIN